MKKLIFTKGGLDTLDYFAEHLRLAAMECDIPHAVLDIRRPLQEQGVRELFNTGKTCAVVMFNNVGLQLIPESIPVYNILVDHPRAFHKVLDQPRKGLHILCVDKNHVSFIQRFYPNTEARFLPHGGAGAGQNTQYQERTIDVLYVGTVHKNPPLSHIDALSDQGESFYRYVIPTLQEETEKTCEEAIREYLASVGQSEHFAAEKLLNEEYGVICEYYVRRRLMLNLLHALDDAGIKVEVYGENWTDSESRFSDHIHIRERISPAACIELMAQSRIVLNMMPWFRNGTHERIYNGMLAGALVVTDDSIYLRETLNDRDDVVFYDRTRPDSLVDIVRHYLTHTEEAGEIAMRGYHTASGRDTWKHRLNELWEAIR